ncbi:RNA polymerase sigma factor [Singulisphaera sp. Ch08]|uniref:RNA polymerase sigma factor n=1 Tax=Singulisphaera sp. Ch08 TaxID=3120278 RepID=A0AAU7CAS2_9BACT
MARGDQGIVLRQLNMLFSMGADGGLTDTQLLERFSSRRDHAAESAFRVLVERHGPMVLRVCRAVLRDPHDAQDAFQATFLVLVQRAGSLWVRDSLAPWLHQVAYRTASGARSAAARRRRHELRAAEFTSRSAHPGDHDDLAGAVHDEVGRLPERFREAVVLCLLEGLTPEQAARHLGCPVGTVHSRLARGRERLRGRLARRGVAVPIGLLAAPLGSAPTQVAVSAELLQTTISAAVRVAAAKGAITTGTVSAQVAALIEGELSMMALVKLKWVAVAFLVALLGISAAGIRGATATVLQSQASADEPRSDDDSPPTTRVPVTDHQAMENWWTELEKDEPEASRALLKLADRPADTVPFLKGKLKPLILDGNRLKELLVKLGSMDENDWRPAFAELEYFDPRLAVELETLMTDVGESPTRQRIVAVLGGHPADTFEGKAVILRPVDGGFNFFVTPGGAWWAEHDVARINRGQVTKKKWIRAVRAIALLEHLGTPEAVAILKEMATGHPLAQPTRAAKQASEKLGGNAR